MYTLLSQCPVCNDDLLVTRLECRNCGSTLEGRFSLSRLCQLTPEQLHFVEVFLRCEGKITRVQEDLGLSYPTVRSRLNEVIRALGYQAGEGFAADEEQRRSILDDLAQGKLSAEEAIQLLQRG